MILDFDPCCRVITACVCPTVAKLDDTRMHQTQARCPLLLPGRVGGGVRESILEPHRLPLTLSPLLSSWEATASEKSSSFPVGRRGEKQYLLHGVVGRIEYVAHSRWCINACCASP